MAHWFRSYCVPSWFYLKLTNKIINDTKWIISYESYILSIGKQFQAAHDKWFSNVEVLHTYSRILKEMGDTFTLIGIRLKWTWTSIDSFTNDLFIYFQEIVDKHKIFLAAINHLCARALFK